MTGGGFEAELTQAREFQNQGQHHQALRVLDALDKRHPGQPDILAARATSMVEVGRFDEALAVCGFLRDVGHATAAEPIEVELRGRAPQVFAEPASPRDAGAAQGGSGIVGAILRYGVLLLLALVVGYGLHTFFPLSGEPAPAPPPAPKPAARQEPAEAVQPKPPAARTVQVPQGFNAFIRNWRERGGKWTPVNASQGTLEVADGYDLMLQPTVAATEATTSLLAELPPDALQVLDLTEAPLTGGGSALFGHLAGAGTVQDSVENGPRGNLVGLMGLRLSGEARPLAHDEVRFVGGMLALEELEIENASLHDRDVACLQSLTNMKRLTLRNVGLRDRQLRHLAPLTELERLDLPGNPKLTDGALAYLKEFSGLRMLDLSAAQMSDAAMKELDVALPRCLIEHASPDVPDPYALVRTVVFPPASLGRLETCPWDAQSKDAWEPLGEAMGPVRVSVATALRLRCSQSIAEEDRFGELASLGPDSVQALVLEEIPVDDGMLEAVGSLEGLLALDLDRTEITDAGLVHLTGLSKLRKLSLNHTSVTDRGVSQLASLPALEHIEVAGTNLFGEAFRGFADTNQLRVLRAGPAILNKNLSHVGRMTRLRELALLGPRAVIEGGGGFSGVRYSVSESPGLTDAGVRALRPLRNLHRVSLQGNPVSDASVAVLGVLRGVLRHADLRETAVTAKGRQRLEEMVPGAEVVGTSLSSDAFAMGASTPGWALAQADTPPPGRTVQFGSSRSIGEVIITPAGTRRLLKEFKDARGPVKIAAGETAALELRPEGLSQWLSVAPKFRPYDIQELTVKAAGFGDAHLRAAGSLTMLRELDVSDTSVTDLGLPALLDMPFLGKLDISRTQVTEDGLRWLKTRFPACEIAYIPAG